MYQSSFLNLTKMSKTGFFVYLISLDSSGLNPLKVPAVHLTRIKSGVHILILYFSSTEHMYSVMMKKKQREWL